MSALEATERAPARRAFSDVQEAEYSSIERVMSCMPLSSIVEERVSQMSKSVVKQIRVRFRELKEGARQGSEDLERSENCLPPCHLGIRSHPLSPALCYTVRDERLMRSHRPKEG